MSMSKNEENALQMILDAAKLLDWKLAFETDTDEIEGMIIGNDAFINRHVPDQENDDFSEN